jgi:outer membrane immunogenic protein
LPGTPDSDFNFLVAVARSFRRGLIMHRFRFAAHAAALLVAVSGAFTFSVSAAYAACAAVIGSNSARASGFLAGGQAGYNWQQGSWVYGLETDLSGTRLKSSMSGGLSTPGCPNDAANTSSSINWYGTARGRAGVTTGNFLFYGTGGLAYGKVDLNSNFNALGLSTSAQTSSTRAGWVVGAGIEYLLQPNLFLNFGYQYVDLGSVNLASSTTVGGSTISQTASARAAFHVATLGLSWRFSPANMAPWQGMYIGGHGGGAWGDSASANYSSVVLISDARLKRDITLVGRRDDGLGLYRYRYLWSDTVYVGVMAQEVALIHPDAVVRSGLDHYLRVDYGRLGLQLIILPEWEARSQAERL